MVSLNTQIIAYFSVNNISYTNEDYVVTQTGNNPEKITYWDVAALGAEPTQAQLDAALPIYEGEQIAAQNKQQATALLQETDWTTIPDVADSALSDPYLTNTAEFAAYRSNVRKIAVNPPTTPAVFPPVPDEIWAYSNA